MSTPRGVAMMACLIVAACGCRAQISENWFPATKQDLALKSAPGDPGAAAIQLDYSDAIDDRMHSRFIHRRIKILNDKGRQYGDVEIPAPENCTISDLRARTIRPDGSVALFSGRPFEKLILSRYPRKIVAKTLSLPEVRAGSIVEYKYRLNCEQHVFDTTWAVQHDLYTLRERFWLRPFQGKLETRHGGDDTQLSYVYSNMPDGVKPRETAGGIELTLENVPAFRAEEWMPPEENFRPEVRFFYGGREVESPEAFWQDAGREWYDQAERFMSGKKEIQEAATEIAGEEPDPRKKLEKLYARVQRLRNLSFEPQRSRSEAKKENLKPNENAAQALTRGYAFQNEIAELFTALARSAGFEAELLRASSREERVFDERLLSTEQLRWEIVRITLGNDEIYAAPGTVYCPFGTVPWQYTAAPALKLSKQGGEFVVLPPATADKTVLRRTAEMAISSDGLLSGEITLEFKGDEALMRRIDALELDENARDRAMEQELLNWLPPRSRVRLKSASGWDNAEQPLVLRFDAEVQDFGSRTGKRLLVPTGLFLSPRTENFTSDKRKYPVYFPYAYQEIDNLSIHAPDTYRIQMAPGGEDTRLPSLRLITSRSSYGQQLKLTKALVVNSIYFQPEEYSSIREVFNKARSSRTGQAVIEGP